MTDIPVTYILTALVASAVTIIITFYIYLNKQHRYWKELGVPGPKPDFFFGTMKSLYMLKETECNIIHRVYKEYDTEKYVGIYNLWKPILLIRDLDLIKDVTENDFEHFMDHPEVRGHAESDSIFESIFFMKGVAWKQRRQVLAKLFTPKKLKEYMVDFQKSIDLTLSTIRKKYNENKDIELLSTFTSTAVHFISASLFGLDLTQDEKMTKDMIQTSLLFSHAPFTTVLKFSFFSVSPTLYNLFRMRTFTTQIWDFFSSLTHCIIEKRKVVADDRNDLVTVVKTLMEEGSKEFGKIQFKEAVGHMYTFFTGAHQTSELTIGHTLFQISLHPQVQAKLHQELDNVLNGEKFISYENLGKLTYLDCVLYESMRMYTLVGVQKRTCTKDYLLDGRLAIPKDMDIYLPVHSLHTDEKYFHDSDKFLPERFLEGQKNNPALMPFGKGPRLCIGLRFGEIVVKLCIARILMEYQIVASQKTNLPLKYQIKTIITSSRPAEGLYITVKPR